MPKILGMRQRWVALVLRLPTRSAAGRMRVWRALKGLGAASLRDGVYLLPFSDTTEQAFLQIAEDVQSASGSAHVVELVCRSDAQSKELISLFDRTDDYGQLLRFLNHT